MMVTVVSDSRDAQRLVALERANRTRTQRRLLKAGLKDGSRELLPLLMDPPWWVGSMAIGELLMALPRWGRVQSLRFLNLARPPLSLTCPVGALTEGRRRDLCVRLRGMGVR